MSDIVIYESSDGESRLQVHLDQETVWLSLNQMAELFERNKSVISKHLNNIFKSGELARNSVVAKNATTAADGKTYQVDFYNLDAIISVGYRVNSIRGTQFRHWATSTGATTEWNRSHALSLRSLKTPRRKERNLG